MIDVSPERAEELRNSVYLIEIPIAKDLFADEDGHADAGYDTERIAWLISYARKEFAITFPEAQVLTEVDWQPYLTMFGNHFRSDARNLDLAEIEEIQDAIDNIVDEAIRFAERA